MGIWCDCYQDIVSPESGCDNCPTMQAKLHPDVKRAVKDFLEGFSRDYRARIEERKGGDHAAR